jgi:predicted regulator of Ras-like GTPase activity (Roadblock/LC7/MglB family)
LGTRGNRQTEKLNIGILFIPYKGDNLKSKTFESVFKDLKRNGARICVISSMSGVPVAWFGTEKKSVELYSTLSAAMISAGRILHKEADSSGPYEVISRSRDSIMAIKEINDDSIFLVISDKMSEELSKACERASKELRGVMT